MDSKVLVARLKGVFEKINAQERVVDCAGLVSVYPDLENSPFILLVSMPQTQHLSCSGKISFVADYLYDNLDSAELELVDRVRVYASKESLETDMELGEQGFRYTCEDLVASRFLVS